MGGFFLGLVKQQWQAVLRAALYVAGTFLASRGLVTKDQWAQWAPQLETIIGGIVVAGTAQWSVSSNKPETIISTADDLRAKGH